MTKGILPSLLVTIAVACGSPSALSQPERLGFHVQGTLSNRRVLDGESAATNRWRFDVQVLGETWLLTTHWEDGLVCTYGCNGQDVYAQLVRDDSPDTEHRGTGNGIIFSGIYPVQGAGVSTAVLWLAYASSSYFRTAAVSHATSNRPLPAPWTSPASDPLAFIYGTEVTFLDDHARLPSRVEYTPDPTAMSALLDGTLNTVLGVTKSEHDRASMQILARYSKIHHPEGIYSVLETTNQHGNPLPRRFAFKRYLPSFLVSADQNATDSPMVLYSVTEGSLESLAEITELDCLPPMRSPEQVLHVADYRFVNVASNIGFVTYEIRDRQWITNREDPYLQSLVTRAAAQGAWYEKLSFLRPSVAAALFLALVLAPLLSSPVRKWLVTVTR